MDFKEIQTIIRNFEKSNLTELEIEKGDFKLRLSKQLFKEKESQEVKNVETEEVKILTWLRSKLLWLVPFI